MWEAGGRAKVHQREELGGRGTAPGELQGPRDWSIGVCEEQLQEWMGGLGAGGEGSGRNNFGSEEDRLGLSVEGGWGRDLTERVKPQ